MMRIARYNRVCSQILFHAMNSAFKIESGSCVSEWDLAAPMVGAIVHPKENIDHTVECSPDKMPERVHCS
jgi:hypothetical protein